MTRRGKKSGSSPKPPLSPAFYLDVSVPVFVGETLRGQGYNAQLVPSELRQATDVTQLIVATKAGRILIAVDKDFRSYTFPARRILESPGVVLISTAKPTPEHYRQLTLKLLKYLSSKSIVGKLCLLSDAGPRTRLVAE
ncbi:MAG: DUF5615 family PIN-like protein [Candidatus Berkelbacteria bacterium]|nr:DUF5615 family PIN-like protein [Candidatus Berkelbacteria bacterium]MCR4307881.1 DUF5615 family PIN-like protein [Candidatus Berkelbacteria bacterium]